MGDSDERTRRILDVIMALGEGEVTSYGDVADVAGHPRNARLVGRILGRGCVTGDSELPWWRIVTSSGRLVPGNEREHAALLRAEGVTVRAGRVVGAPVGRFSRSPDPGRPASRRRGSARPARDRPASRSSDGHP